MLFDCHFQVRKRSKIGRFFKTFTTDIVKEIEALDETHARNIIKTNYGIFTKIFNVFEKAK